MAIKNLDNKAARQIWDGKACKDLPAHHHERPKMLLEIMNATSTIHDLAAKGSPPDCRAHKLKGKMSGRWAVDIDKTSGWRITFKFKSGEFIDVRIENYH